MLASRASGTEGFQLQIGGGDFDDNLIVHQGVKLNRRKGGMAALIGVEGGDADQAVDAVFRLEKSVGVFAFDGDRNASVARPVAVGEIDDLRLKTLLLAVPKVHAKQHASPVAGFGAPRP